ERRAFSTHRQRSRAIMLGRTVDEARYQRRIVIAEQREVLAVARARALGLRVSPIDPRQPLHVVHRAVRQAVRLDYERLPWNWDALWTLHEVAPHAYLVGGSFYRPFFNGVRGPMQESWDVGVAVGSEQDVVEVRRMLLARAPHVRWRVGDAVSFMRTKLDMTIRTLEEALQLSHNLTGLSGGARMHGDGIVEIVCGPDAEAHLRRGILEPNDTTDVPEAARKAHALVHQYPGLVASFIQHHPYPVIPDWATIHREVAAMEEGGRRCWSSLSPTEATIAEEIRTFAASADKQPTAPPMPRPAALPVGDPWEAPDAAFREWLLTELRNPMPTQLRDPLLAIGLREQFGYAQKPTHQGWPLHQHAAGALLLIETDHFPEHRRALRVATLFHDLGKRWNVRTPGAHGRIGMRRWVRFAPDWLTGVERALTAFLIRNHDLLGRLARGVKEADFRGAVDPAYIRTMLQYSGAPPADTLAMLLAMNRADIGAVASLRWTLPELDLAKRMVASDLTA
ncbi:MAG: hypothetical protein Q8R16_02635, partial [bacterium]|nr:hypothetical protein [bacterium]